MRPGRRLAPYSARRRSSTTPAPAASSRTAATANAIVEAPVLLRPLGSVASTLPFGLGLTAGFCGAASASATWAGVAPSSAATFFAASRAASNSSEPDYKSGSASLPASAITSFRAVLSADLTVTSKDFAKSVPLSATVTVTLPAAANGFARSTGLPARRVFMAWLVHEILMFSRYYRRCEMKVGSVL